MDTSGEVLGRCMEQSIGPDYFYHFSHQLIFDSLLELHRENKQPDEILLAENFPPEVSSSKWEVRKA